MLWKLSSYLLHHLRWPLRKTKQHSNLNLLYNQLSNAELIAECGGRKWYLRNFIILHWSFSTVSIIQHNIIYANHMVKNIMSVSSSAFSQISLLWLMDNNSCIELQYLYKIWFFVYSKNDFYPFPKLRHCIKIIKVDYKQIFNAKVIE